MRTLPTIAALALALSTQASAGETGAGSVTIHDAWAAVPPGASSAAAAYLTLEVTGRVADRLLAAQTPAAEDALLHGYWMEGCFAHRRPLEAIEVAPGGPTMLGPGGPHVLLVGLRRALTDGDTIALSLTFEHAGTVEIEVPVRAERPRPVPSMTN